MVAVPMGMRCTDASAEAFGVETLEAHDAFEVATAIKAQTGRTWQPVQVEDVHYGTTPTIARFAREHPEGDFLVVTAGHCMALRDGELTDTEFGGPRRRVVGVVRINR